MGFFFLPYYARGVPTSVYPLKGTLQQPYTGLWAARIMSESFMKLYGKCEEIIIKRTAGDKSPVEAGVARLAMTAKFAATIAPIFLYH
jgi:hypothetical protein